MDNLEHTRTLVLNADFRPLRVAPLSTFGWQEAISAVMADRVMVLSHYEDCFVRSQKTRMQIPSVVALKNYVSLDQPAAVTRQNLYAYHGNACAYCGETFSTRELTIDHVIPKSRFPKEERHKASVGENLVLACVACNGRKANRTPAEARMPLRVTPRQPTVAEINNKAVRFLQSEAMPRSWIDALYWTTELVG